MTDFLNAMRSKWAEFGNVESPALLDVWALIKATLDRQDASTVWPVIPAELGAGKSTAAKMWCVTAEQPRVLIVVRTKDQADEYARDINAWSGRPLAFAHHSGLPLAARRDLDALVAYPVLVVCHKSYENGLDDFAVDVSRLKFEKMHAQRSLVIIDEALDQVHEERIPRDALKLLLTQMPRAVEKAHPDALRIIESVNRALREAPDERNRAFTAAELLALTPFTVDQADALLLAAWEHGLRRAKGVEPELRAQLGQTLAALRRYLGAYSWTAGDGPKTALSGHHLLLLPPGTHGVIFDATARLNNVYIGRPEEFRVLDTTPVRDYHTVTIHEARTTETGKRAARSAGPKLAAETVAALRAHYGDEAPTRRVLVVTAKVVETHFRKVGAAAGFAAFDVAHWNKIDGRNDWRDYDTLCIATLPYATNSLDLNIFMAVREAALDDDALNAPPDEVMLVRENRMAAQFAQAIGRIRLRTMTKGDGTCEPCDIFLRLPNSRRQVDSDRILDAITRTLPGAAVVRWERASRKLGHRPPSTRDAAVARLLRLPAGSAVTAKAIKATHGTWQRILESATTTDHPLNLALAERGLRLVRGGNLRGDSGRALPWLAPIPEV